MGNASSSSSSSPFAGLSNRNSLARTLPSRDVDDLARVTASPTTCPLSRSLQKKQANPVPVVSSPSSLLHGVTALLSDPPLNVHLDEQTEKRNVDSDAEEDEGDSKGRKAGRKENAKPVPFQREANQHLAAVYALEQSSPFVGSPLSSSDYFPDAATTSRSHLQASSRTRKETSKRVTSASPPSGGKNYVCRSQPQKASLLSSALAAAALVHQNSQGSRLASASRDEFNRPPAPTVLWRSASTSIVPDNISPRGTQQEVIGMGSAVALSDRRSSFAPEGIVDLPKRNYRNSAKIIHGFGANGGDVSPMRKLDFDPAAFVPTIITWSQGGGNVYVTGTFNGWKHKIRLSKSTTDFTTVLDLPPGTHSLKFVVDDEWRCSEDLDVSRDAEGNMINIIKVMEPNETGEDFENEFAFDGTQVQNGEGKAESGEIIVPSDGSDGVAADTTARQRRQAEKTRAESPSSSPPTEYSFTLPKYLQRLDPTFNDNCSFVNVKPKKESGIPPSLLSGNRGNISDDVASDVLPPSLPRHLEKVLLNTATPLPAKTCGRPLVPSPNLMQHSQQSHYFSNKHYQTIDDSASAPPCVDVDVSALPVPNHVVINHLYACSIRDGVIAVASTVRYRRKYVTTVLYKPVFS